MEAQTTKGLGNRAEPTLITGCDYHPASSKLQLWTARPRSAGNGAWRAHRQEAEQFYTALQGQSVRVATEASGYSRWFERLLREMQFELWIGDAAKVSSKRVHTQKTDLQDAQLSLRLLLEDRFPRI